MNFALSEEQTLLRETVREFVSRESSLRRIRELRDDPIGFSPEVWGKMAGLGLSGLLLPEALGGQGLGMVEMAVVMEELGRGLMPEPMLSCAVMGATALLLGGSKAQQQAWLPGVAAGETLLSLACQEPQSRYDPFDVATTAKSEGGGWTLNGEKAFVPEAHRAQALVVTARTGGNRRDREGVALFLVEADQPGVELEAIPTMDSRRRYKVKLNQVKLEGPALMEGELPPDQALERTLDRAATALSAEMLGAMNAAFDMTLDYLRTRKQFGQPIGAFQALKHRAADEYMQAELARSAVYYAAMCIDEQMPDAPVAVSTAKARCNDAARLITNESIQMHGGIGMTDEHDIGFYFKHARVAGMTLGDTAFHQERYARLKEY